MQHKHSDDDGCESHGQTQTVVPAQISELIVEDARGNHHERSEEHVVDWTDLHIVYVDQESRLLF